MEELRTKYGAAKMEGFRVDPATHALLHPAVLPCSVKTFEMGALHNTYNTYNAYVYERIADAIRSIVYDRNNASNAGMLRSNWLRLSCFSISKGFRTKFYDHSSFPVARWTND
ncbi:Hypothetical protein, putative [Bodo saltans]|uniref:Uncharacterized protein n=1 Tax=Bodo saltans TaxID=75058 RepID=A0A0S4IYC3_BODSA|nr:Hypothetical protein, putative [Bodo saltans]|eukprot:CUG16701.1 Hypothetical protein, putative [Bodo saltans]